MAQKIFQAGRLGLGVGYYYAHIAGYLALSVRAPIELAVCVSLSQTLRAYVVTRPAFLIAFLALCAGTVTVLYCTVRRSENSNEYNACQ